MGTEAPAAIRDPAIPHRRDASGSAGRPGVLAAGILVVVLGVALHRTATTMPLVGADGLLPDHAAASLLLNPNTATWWELTVLPGIGEVTARRIVEHRQSRTVDGGNAADVYRTPADLQQVKGIGPLTAARMAPYLAFGSSAARAQRTP